MKQKKQGGKRKLIKYTLVGITSIVLVGSVIYFTGKNTNESSSKSSIDSSQITKLEVDSSMVQTTEKRNIPMEVNQHPEINTLVDRYFQAIMNSDIETLNSIVESNVPFEKEQLDRQREFIEGYENIVCYTKEVLLEDTYIVYVSYDIKFLNINTKAPALIRLYVCQNEEGGMYIYRGELEGEVSAYLEEVGNSSEITDLVRSVNSQLDQVRSSEKELDALISMLENGSVESTSEESSTEEMVVDTTESSSEEITSNEATSSSNIEEIDSSASVEDSTEQTVVETGETQASN